MADNFDLIVLGGGPGGVAAAIRGVQLGARVALVEDSLWGGVCLNRACVPTKLFTTTLDRLGTIRAAAEFGFSEVSARVDEPALWGLKNELVGYFSMGTKGLVGSHGVELIEGRGKLTGLGRILVGGEEIQAGAIVIATGAGFVRPSFPGAEAVGVVDSTRFLEQEKLPERVLILGGGPWQLELGQFLAAAGKEALVVEPGRQILPGWDQEISQRLRSIINVAPLTILNSSRIVSASEKEGRLAVSLETREGASEEIVDQVIHFERQPRLEGLGLDTVGLDDLGVDEHLATAARGIWAVGDVTGEGPFLSHRSSALGVVAAENALGGRRTFNPRAVPQVAFTRPQAASVGLGEEEAEDRDYDVITGEATMGVSPMAMIQGQSNGVVKVVGESGYGELLGVHLVAPMATEIIGAGALAVQMEATLEDLARSCLPHPTISESLADAAREALGWAIYMPK